VHGVGRESRSRVAVRAIGGVLALGTALGVAPPAGALSPSELSAIYEALWQGRFARDGVEVPAGGVELRADVATWRLEAGEIRALAPLPDGRLAGCLVRGRGRFRMEVPHPVERAHLARVRESEEVEALDVAFDELLLRGVEGQCEAMGARALPPYAGDREAAVRRDVWIQRRLLDPEAAAVRGLAGDAPGWLLAEMRTAEHGWLLFEVDPDRREEIALAQWRSDRLVWEEWVRLDRAGERAADGRTASATPRQLDLLHADVRVDLTRPARRPKAGFAGFHPRRARFEVELRFRPLRPELRTLLLALDPLLILAEVRDEEGRPVPFLRDAVGERNRTFDDELQDDTLLLLLDEPLGARERTLTFHYEGDILNYVAGRGWYPHEEAAHHDPHTGTIELAGLRKHDLRAPGRRVADQEEGGERMRRWEVERPVRALTFALAERFTEERVERPGIPAVTAYSARGGGRNRVRKVANDVADALAFFTARFGPGPETSDLLVTSVIGGHGQAFEGFLHLAEGSWESESLGPTQLFRAHEVAHQWWGQLVAFDSYRDQWLSEALAEHSAMLFVEAHLPKGEELYRDLVATYAAAAMGETRISRFRRAFSPPVNPRQLARAGPVALGWRAATADLPGAFFVQSYYKGALVLHMLRTRLREASGDDALHFAILSEYARAHRDGVASTADFVAAVARHAPGDWEAFFRFWLEETAIPAWTWSWSAATLAGGRSGIVIELAQVDLPPGGLPPTPVPVAVELADGRSQRALVEIDGATTRIELPLDGEPRRVELNPDFAVLARTKRR
jgi:hypothetical protein